MISSQEFSLGTSIHVSLKNDALKIGKDILQSGFKGKLSPFLFRGVLDLTVRGRVLVEIDRSKRGHANFFDLMVFEEFFNLGQEIGWCAGLHLLLFDYFYFLIQSATDLVNLMTENVVKVPPVSIAPIIFELTF